MSDTARVECWYALQVRSRHEKSVSIHLTVKGYETFVPLSLERHRWADRIKLVELPLFPGYVFCRFQAAYRHPVLGTPGVVDVVRMGDDPAIVDTPEIEALKRATAARLATESLPRLVTGEHVYMSDGPLAGLSGIVIDVRKAPRLVLSVTLLQRSVLVEIDRDWVTPLASPGISCSCYTEPLSAARRKLA